MPLDGAPFRTDFTDQTPMGPEIHAPIHNSINAALNAISDILDEFAEAPPGTVTEAEMDAAIAAAIGTVTPESIGAIPDSQETLTLTDGVLLIPTLPSHPAAPPADHIGIYGLDDETSWVQTSTGEKTQTGPPWLSPSVVLGTAASISSAASYSNILTAATVSNAWYRVHIFGAYVADTSATTGRLQTAFTVPAGSTGSWTARTIQAAYTGSSGSTTMTQLAKKWNETAASGGAGATVPVPFEVVGLLKTAGTAGDFIWKAKLNEAGPTVTIYGNDTTDYAGAMMTLTRVG